MQKHLLEELSEFQQKKVNLEDCVIQLKADEDKLHFSDKNKSGNFSLKQTHSKRLLTKKEKLFLI